ncbi:M56 family metallopeptidase [Chitinophaga barathri]|uniref:M56 family metallopeptidase n=2 Tax=Chitinophaga barathri TaxID=1647451 RepID=A0A3N4N084_9BACT|nr:M56 family metallopeptidase [Chitinophaga barathri]
MAGAGFTFYLEMQAAPAAPAAIAAAVAVTYAPVPQPDLLACILQFIDAHTMQIMMIWALIFLLKCIRLGAGFYHIFRIRHSNTIQPPVEWAGKLRQLALSLGIHAPVKLMESARVQMPFTVGWLKPCIYVPAGLLAQLPADQLEAILLHELAHIRRRDYLVNILQRFAETIFFFNPALLWISACIREEREACCDDIAMAHTPHRASYLQALVAFENAGEPELQLGMGLGRKRFYLLDRVKRLLTNENKKLTIMEKGILLLGLAGITAFGFVPAGEQSVAQAATTPQLELEIVKDTTVKPFKVVKVKRDTVIRPVKRVPLKSDSVKVYKLKSKDSVRVITFSTDTVYYKMYKQLQSKDSLLAYKLYQIAMDTTRLKSMKGQYLKEMKVDSVYRMQYLEKMKGFDSTFMHVLKSNLTTQSDQLHYKLYKMAADTILLKSLKMKLSSHWDSTYKNQKFKSLSADSTLQKKMKSKPARKEAGGDDLFKPTSLQVTKVPQRTVKINAFLKQVQLNTDVIRIEPITYALFEAYDATGSLPQEKKPAAPERKKSPVKEVKKEPAKIKWHSPKHIKPSFREKAEQSLPPALQKQFVPPADQC